MGIVYCDVQHYFRILQFRYGGEEYGEMMIFSLHCYSTAAMPYMGARWRGGGALVGVHLFLEFFPCGFFFTLWGPFSPCGGPFFSLWGPQAGSLIFMWGLLLSLGRNGRGVVVSGGGGWNCPSLNISLGALDTIRTFSMKLLH